MTEHNTVVSMERITKRFPGVVANENVNLDLREGEVHTLLGENGAGKSTLMNILTGIYRADSGCIYIDGKSVNFRSPRDAIANGIGMVHQHFKLVSSHTVAENIILGVKGGIERLNLKHVEEQTAHLSEQYDLKVDPKAHIWQLSIGEQQRVEILKTLFRGTKILILDEPTAVLTPQESQELFTTLRAMTEKGHSVVFISHKLDEVMEISTRITVLQGGRLVGETMPDETNKQELSKMMVGREVMFEFDHKEHQPRDPVLVVQNLNAFNDRGLPALKNVTLTVASGEILGIAGVAGNGQQELAEAVTGARSISSGTINLECRDMTNAGARDYIEEGVAYVPADRNGVASVGNLSLANNIILKRYRENKFANGLFLNYEAINSFADELINRFNIVTPGHEVAVRLLSGGNLQKVILAREITSHHKLLVVMSPTRGLDVGATDFIRKTIDQQRQEGTAILLISEDLEELFSLSDRIGVLFSGEIMGTLPIGDSNAETIGLMMAGVKRLTGSVANNPSSNSDPISGETH